MISNNVVVNLKQKELVKENNERIFFLMKTIGSYTWYDSLTAEQLTEVRRCVNTFVKWDRCNPKGSGV